MSSVSTPVTPFFSMKHACLYHGDAVETLDALPPEYHEHLVK